jgi:hypothetical protein
MGSIEMFLMIWNMAAGLISTSGRDTDFGQDLAYVFQPDLGETTRQDLGETSLNMEGDTRNGVEATKNSIE